jgi:AcrR family transcriptional regulator
MDSDQPVERSGGDAMPRQLKSGAEPAWQWSRTQQTQQALLDAARQVFTERGFAESSVAEIVDRAGSSVGSLYHHFGGKSELFIALWQEHQLAHEQAASQAVVAARKQGVSDRGQLFEAGARAFLHGSWERRDLALLFSAGDAPAGFEVMRRRRGREWISQNDSLLQLTDTPAERVYAAILTSLIGEGAYEVAAARNRRQADAITDAVAEYGRRLMAGGPARLQKPVPLPDGHGAGVQATSSGVMGESRTIRSRGSGGCWIPPMSHTIESHRR